MIERWFRNLKFHIQLGQCSEEKENHLFLWCFFFITFFKNFYWSIVDLQRCVSFRCTAKWICYTYTYIHSFFKKINLFIYFIFGCVGSSLLWAGFLWLQRTGATLHCGARASHRGGFSCCRAQALGSRASCRLSSCGSWALECRLSSCGARA